MSKKISVIIPAYNEEKRLGKTLGLWNNFLNARSLEFGISEIIIADDGSTDNTVKIAENFKPTLPIKIIKIWPNQGKGYAVKTGILASTGDFIFIYDADAAVLPQEIKKLLSFADEYSAIIGSRKQKGANVKMSFLRKLVGNCFHLVCFPLIPGIKDASCGAKIFSKEAAKIIFSEQKIKRFAFDIEILWLVKKHKFKIKEVGIEWQEISGSKINIVKDSLEMLISVVGIYKRAFFR